MASSTPTKIAILDDYQNLALPHFQHFDQSKFEVTVFRDTLLPFNSPSTPENVKAELIQRLEPFTIICTMRERTPFPKELLEKLPNLKLLLTTGLRNASLDIPAAKALGIKIVGTGGKGRTSLPARADGAVKKASKVKGTDSTTQHAVSMILALARNIAADDAAVKAGGWQTDVAIGLSGKTFGSLGLGRLGVAVAKILSQAFGMKIVAWSSTLTQDVADEKAKSAGLDALDADGEATFKVVSKEELFRTSDVVSLHYVLSERSKGLVGATELGWMKPSGLFVNTSRGPLVVEKDLLEVLKNGTIRGAALDVYDLEPLPKESEWRSTNWGVEGRGRVLLTPHMGYVEEEAMGTWYEENVENIERWVEGKELLYPLN